MKMMKLIACLAALLLVTALPVLAADHQSVTLSQSEEGKQLLVSTENNRAAVWEIPNLKAGERLIEPGTLTLRNLTDEEANIALEYVALPYGNSNALIYLNHLNITVREGDTVLYDGPYTRINDENGLKLDYTLAPNQAVVLTVDLRRDYMPIAVTGFENGTMIDWKFVNVKNIVIDPNPTAPSQTVTTTPTSKPTVPSSTAKPTQAANTESFDDPELAKVFRAVVAAAAVLAVAVVIRWRKER